MVEGLLVHLAEVLSAVPVASVLGQSFALCASWHLVHTCLNQHLPGNMHAPLFQDLPISTPWLGLLLACCC